MTTKQPLPGCDVAEVFVAEESLNLLRRAAEDSAVLKIREDSEKIRRLAGEKS